MGNIMKNRTIKDINPKTISNPKFIWFVSHQIGLENITILHCTIARLES